MLKAILFDMDGVLVDSLNFNFEVFNQILEKYGIHIPKEDYPKYTGTTLKHQLEMWQENYGKTIDIDYIQFGDIAQGRQHKFYEEHIVPNNALSEFIDSAKKEGIKIILTTGNRFSNAKKILTLLEIYNKFDAFITREDVELHKPHPECFLRGANKAGVDASECMVFEDAANGMISAKNAKMKVIGRVTEFHSKEELIKHGADYTFNEFSEINLDIVKKVFDK